MFLPQFVRVFYRLMRDERVSVLAKAVPLLGVLALISLPLLELGFIPSSANSTGSWSVSSASRSSSGCARLTWCAST